MCILLCFCEATWPPPCKWLKTTKTAWDSTHSEDVDKRLYSSRTLKDGTMRFASRTEILTNRTMRLIGLQALNTEHKFMGWAVYKTKTLPAQLQIKGAIVECELLKCNSKDDEQLVKEYFAKQWLPYNESRLLKLKVSEIHCISN